MARVVYLFLFVVMAATAYYMYQYVYVPTTLKTTTTTPAHGTVTTAPPGSSTTTTPVHSSTTTTTPVHSTVTTAPPNSSTTTTAPPTSSTTTTTVIPITNAISILTNYSLSVGQSNYMKYTSNSGTYFFEINGTNGLCSLNSRTGEQVWASSVPSGHTVVSPVTVNVNYANALFNIVDASGTTLWSASSNGSVLTQVSSATLQISDAGAIAIVNTTGQILWES